MEDAVLARVAMDDDEGEVETVHAVHGEIAAVDRTMGAVVGEPIPVGAVDNNLVNVVFIVVEVVVDLTAAVDRDLVLARVSAHYEGDVRFFHGLEIWRFEDL